MNLKEFNNKTTPMTNLSKSFLAIGFFLISFPQKFIAQGVNMDVDQDRISIEADKRYLLAKGKGEYSVWYGCDHNELRRPIILVGGYDPRGVNNYNEPEDVFGDLTDNQVAGNLLAAGYDIVALNYDNGGTYIQRNAYLLVELIEQINDELEANGSNEELVVIGMSMGGLVARGALTYMEDQGGLDHQTRLFISFDSPQQGANVPLGIQHMVDFWATPDAPGDPLDEITPQISGLLNLSAPATKQMADPFFSANPERALFQTWLSSHGNYPNDLRKVAIACGSGDGKDQPSLRPGDPYLTWHHFSLSFEFKNNAYAPPRSHIFEGLIRNPLPVKSRNVNGVGVPSIDDAPGGYYDIEGALETIAERLNTVYKPPTATAHNGRFSFIPTISALDIQTSNYYTSVRDLPNYPEVASSPFDAVYAGDQNLSHLRINDEIAGFFLKELDAETDLFLQNKNETGTEVYTASSEIEAGRNVTHLKPQGDHVIEDGGDVTAIAGEKVRIRPGFRTEKGGRFRASIEEPDCPPFDSSIASAGIKPLQEGNGYSTASTTGIEGLQGERSPGSTDEGQVKGNVARTREADQRYAGNEDIPASIQVEPNPTPGQFILHLPQEMGPAEVTISNSMGKTIMENRKVRTTRKQVDLSNEPEGIYLVRVRMGKDAFVERVVIAR